MTIQKKIDEVTDKALDILAAYLSPGANEEASRKAATARSVLASYMKNEQTKSAREATRFMIARELSENPQQLKKYIQVSMPESRIVKALK